MLVEVQLLERIENINNWMVVKHANGFAECYYNLNIKTKECVISKVEYGYRAYTNKKISFPLSFTEYPNVQVSQVSSGTTSACSVASVKRDKDAILEMYFFRDSQFDTNYDIGLNIRVIGKWK